MTRSTLAAQHGTSANDAGPAVWERLWQHHASAEKDDERVRREQRGPRWRAIERALTDTFGRIEGLRTIELGAGHGDLSLLLAQRGALVTLVDYSQAALDQAAQRFERLDLTAECCPSDLFMASNAAGADYDVAMSLGVIEHFRGPDRLAAIRAHRAVLRPGGMAVIGVPHAACPPYRLWKAYLELRGWWPYGMEIPYTKGEMARLADGAGFSRHHLRCTSFLQSLGDHVCKTFLRWRPAWTDRPSPLDARFGLNLLLLAWNDATTTDRLP